jgi:hypothetical protein
MKKILPTALLVVLALACDEARLLPVAPDGNRSVSVTFSDANPKRGSVIEVTVRTPVGTGAPILGSYSARLELGDGLEFVEAVRVGAAEAIRTSGDTVIAAGASVSGFADGRLFAVRARVLNPTLLDAVRVSLDESMSAGFAGAKRATMAIAGNTGKWGDVSADGSVSAADAQAILTDVVGVALPSGYVKANGDANCDGAVAAADAQIVLSYVVALPVTQFCVGQPMVFSLTLKTYSGDATKPIAVLDDGSKVTVSSWTDNGTNVGNFTQTAYIDQKRSLEFRVTYGSSDLPTRIYDMKTKESITIETRDDRIDYLFFDATGTYATGVAVVTSGTKLQLAKINSTPSFAGQLSAVSNTVSFSAVAKVDAGLGTLIDAPAGLTAYHNATASSGTATAGFKKRMAQVGLLAIAAVDPTTIGGTATNIPAGLVAGGLEAIAVANYPNYHKTAGDTFEQTLGKYLQDGIAADKTPKDAVAEAVAELKSSSTLAPADLGKLATKVGGTSDVLATLAGSSSFQAATGSPAVASTAVEGFAVDNTDKMYTLTGNVGATGSLTVNGTATGGSTIAITGTLTGSSFSGSYSGTPGTGSLTGTTTSLGSCQTQNSSGGQGTFAKTFNMGSSTGDVTFSYDAFSIPDAFRVVNGGVTHLNTGSVSNTGSKTFALSGSIVFVTVSAPLSGTAWNFTLSCPKAPTASKAIAVNAGDNQSAGVGAAVAIAPSVKVTNPTTGAALSGETVTFAVGSGGGSITGASAVTNASGIATVGSWTLGSTAGTNTLTASLTGATGSPVTFTATAAGATIAINDGDKQAQMVSTAVPTAPSVIVKDGAGTPIAGATVTFAVAGGSGSITGGTATTNASGIATVGSWTLGATANLNKLSATITGGASVTIVAAGCSGTGAGFKITLCVGSELTTSQRTAFTTAATKWEGIITGDLADALQNRTAASAYCGTSSWTMTNFTVDDLLIFASLEPIDGVGKVLGSAGPCLIRNTGSLPTVGRMRFDTDDVVKLETDNSLNSVILHEMGHVIGIGSLWDDANFNFLKSPSSSTSKLDTYFSGTNGIAGFNAIGGTSYTGGQKVPVENEHGTGTINSHWRETVFDNELMTGFLNSGVSNPLSLMTVRSLEDFGYTVNTANADTYTKTFTVIGAGGPSTEKKIELLGDVDKLPLAAVDAQGRVVRILRR